MRRVSPTVCTPRANACQGPSALTLLALRTASQCVLGVQLGSALAAIDGKLAVTWRTGWTGHCAAAPCAPPMKASPAMTSHDQQLDIHALCRADCNHELDDGTAQLVLRLAAQNITLLTMS